MEDRDMDEPNWLNIVQLLTLLVTFFTLIALIWQNFLFRRQTSILNKEFQINSRPYLTFIDNETVINTPKGAASGLFASNLYELTTVIINNGTIPAKFGITQKQSMPYPNIEWIKSSSEDGYIFPHQTIILKWNLKWNSSSNEFKLWLQEQENNNKSSRPIEGIILQIEYSPLNDASKEFFTRLESEFIDFAEFDVDKKSVVSKFSWKIIGAN